MNGTALVVANQREVAFTVQIALVPDGFTVEVALAAGDTVRRMETRSPERVLLDIMFADRAGVDSRPNGRARTRERPIVLLSGADAAAGEGDAGQSADDGAASPASAPLRQARGRSLPLLRIDERLQIDRSRRQVVVDGRPASLTPKEFQLLDFLASNRGFVLSRDELLKRVWGYPCTVNSRTVDVHVQRLRRRVEPDLHDPRYVLTVWGVGYKFAEANPSRVSRPDLAQQL